MRLAGEREVDSAPSFPKSTSTYPQLQVQLKHERVENKANLIQIKKLQGDVVSLGTEPSNMKATKKLLEEKDNTIPSLKI